MLSCKAASNLTEKKLNTQLNLKERLQLAMHTSMCDACKKYQKESKEMEEVLNQHICSEDNERYVQKEKLPDEVKEQIIKGLKSE